MTPVQSMVAVTYVRDIDTSRAFYELLGFREQSAGRAPAPVPSPPGLRAEGRQLLQPGKDLRMHRIGRL
jgi:catechol 2,3-dioxygenase-like lactoylglutathione lyase family enzyme